MSQDISQLISGMLSNPDALKNLMSSMAGSSQNSPLPQDNSLPAERNSDREVTDSFSPAIPDFTQDSNLQSSVQSMLSALNRADDRRITLLTALKPYLSSSRASGVDRAIKILKLTKLTEVLRNERQ